MVLRSTVNRQIRTREGFDVKIKRDGRVINKNSQLPPYDRWEKALRGDKSVEFWKNKRFFVCFPGYEVDVLKADGTVARGNNFLNTVRDSYLDE